MLPKSTVQTKSWFLKWEHTNIWRKQIRNTELKDRIDSLNMTQFIFSSVLFSNTNSKIQINTLWLLTSIFYIAKKPPSLVLEILLEKQSFCALTKRDTWSTWNDCITNDTVLCFANKLLSPIGCSLNAI